MRTCAPCTCTHGVRPQLTRVHVLLTCMAAAAASSLDQNELSLRTTGEKEQVVLGRTAVFKFTAIQCLCLLSLWALKLSPSTALIFPSVIGVLMVLRATAIPKLFSSRELMLLDTAIGATSA